MSYILPGTQGRLLKKLSEWKLSEDGGSFDPVRWIIERLEEGCFIMAFEGCGDYVLTRAEWNELKREIFERDNHRCVYCGEPATCADHVLPKAWGGLTVERNLVAACRSCNSRKGGRL